jgi:hypothetical protein
LTEAGDKVNDKTWQARIGQTVLSYFKGLKYQLERQGSSHFDLPSRSKLTRRALGFKDDDMLQEGLQEIVESKTFKVRVLPKTNSTTETVIEDGVVYLQTSPERWGYNS